MASVYVGCKRPGAVVCTVSMISPENCNDTITCDVAEKLGLDKEGILRHCKDARLERIEKR